MRYTECDIIQYFKVTRFVNSGFQPIFLILSLINPLNQLR